MSEGSPMRRQRNFPSEGGKPHASDPTHAAPALDPFSIEDPVSPRNWPVGQGTSGDVTTTLGKWTLPSVGIG